MTTGLIAGARGMRTCRDCQAGDDHCHATLIVHHDEWAECSGPGPCDARVDRHVLIEACTELQPDCACV